MGAVTVMVKQRLGLYMTWTSTYQALEHYFSVKGHFENVAAAALRKNFIGLETELQVCKCVVMEVMTLVIPR